MTTEGVKAKREKVLAVFREIAQCLSRRDQEKHKINLALMEDFLRPPEHHDAPAKPLMKDGKP